VELKDPRVGAVFALSDAATKRERLLLTAAPAKTVPKGVYGMNVRLHGIKVRK